MSKASTGIALFLAVDVAVGILVGIFLWRQHGGDGANAAGLESVIDAKIAALNLPQRTTELPTETARHVRGAIKHGDYAAADKIYADVLASSHLESWRFYPFTDFIEGVVDLDDPAFETGLDAWVERNESDAAARLVRARYYADVAWAKRGHAYSDKTAAAGMAAFQTYTDKALADCDAALRLDPANPYAFYLRLSILRGLGVSPRLMSAFQEAIDKYPGYYALYRKMLNSLQPKWGGDVSAMYAFVDRYAAAAGENAPLRLLYVALYQDLLETTYATCDSVRQDADKLQKCMSSTMQSLVTPALEDAIPSALQLYDHADKYQFGIALDDMLSDMLKWGAGEPYAGAILEIAADRMHSNTQLKPDRPVANDYIVDKLAAESWYWKGFYDNALQKTREALADIDATTFPSAAEKDRAIAGILEYAASAYNKLGQLADAIAYDEAALALGDMIGEEQYICYGYYTLKDYDSAIRLCTRAIDDSANAVEAHYWRGAAHRMKGEADPALKDLMLVAGSEHRLRASAAIDMSMIYFGRSDNRGALDVLNRYDYLYDPDQVDRESLAVAYNNRCYAYMELGELTKALDDCKQSLKYGSIPDAYSKQRELMKRLNARETPS